MKDFLKTKLRLIGFYNKPNQTMSDEITDADSANLLASLLKKSFDDLSQNDKVDAIFKSILLGNTVFVLKDEDSNLYAYYPYKEKAKVTGVKYDKKSVTPVPLQYKGWFIPGEAISLTNPKNPSNSNRHHRATISTSGSDFLITRNGTTLPLDWDEDTRISISELSALIENPWMYLVTYNTDDDCGSCDGYDYSNCDMSRCKNDCEHCGGRRYICNNGCFNHRYDKAQRLVVNSEEVKKDLLPLIEILKLVKEPNKPENRLLFSQYNCDLSRSYDECKLISHYFSDETIDDFIALMDLCTTLSAAREDIENCTMFSLYIGSKRIFYGDINSVECRDGAEFLPWKTYHIDTKFTGAYNKDTDSLIRFDYKLKFKSKTERNKFVELFQSNQIVTVYLSDTSDSKKEVLKYIVSK